jgi:23S rRNA (guanosine2251-2'-O)-methyltransferase
MKGRRGKSKGKPKGKRGGKPPAGRRSSPSNPFKVQAAKRRAAGKSAPARPEGRPKHKDSGRWIYGRHVVEESLEGLARVHVVCVYHGQKGAYADLIERAKRRGATVRVVPRQELDKIAEGGAHQGLAAKIAEREGKSLEAFVAGMSEAKKKGCVLVALDQIQDPHNFGAIARSAACLGAAGLITTEFRSATISQTVLQTSAGAIQKIPSFRVTNLGQSLLKLKEAGFWIYGADASGIDSWKATLNRPMVLVIGAEGKGIRPLVKSYCDEVVRIPQAAEGVSSLNASCAASVLLYEAARQAKR